MWFLGLGKVKYLQSKHSFRTHPNHYFSLSITQEIFRYTQSHSIWAITKRKMINCVEKQKFFKKLGSISFSYSIFWSRHIATIWVRDFFQWFSICIKVWGLRALFAFHLVDFVMKFSLKMKRRDHSAGFGFLDINEVFWSPGDTVSIDLDFLWMIE